MQRDSGITFYLFTVFDYYPNFGIGDFVAGTTPVALIEQTFTFYRGFHLLTLTNGFVFHQSLSQQTEIIVIIGSMAALGNFLRRSLRNLN